LPNGVQSACRIQSESQLQHERLERFGLMTGRLLLTLPATALRVDLWSRFISRPIQEAAAQVGARHVDDCSPVETRQPPSEPEPLLSAFNSLLAQVAGVAREERCFSAHLAHGLRTPLAAMRINAQLLSQSGAGAQAEIAGGLVLLIDRATRLMDQLLTLARLESASLRGLQSESFRLDRVPQEALEPLQGLIATPELQLSMHLTPVELKGPMQAHFVSLRNLIENSVRDTARSSAVSIRLSRGDQRWRFELSDGGAGLAQRSDGSGAAFGLAIIRRTLDLLGLTI